MINILNSIIVDLEACSKFLWKNERKEFAGLYVTVFPKLVEILPQIISSYYDEKMESFKEMAVFWPNQIQKVMDLVNNEYDSYVIADAIYFELREMLIMYRDVAEKLDVI